MAIISLVLGGAFVTTHNSQVAVRDSQEHSEALQLLESQVEQLRTAASSGGASSGVFVANKQFCMVNAAAVMFPSGNCTQKSNGSQVAYQLSITCPGADAQGGWLFKISVTWAEVTGSGNGSEVMYYRLYE